LSPFACFRSPSGSPSGALRFATLRKKGRRVNSRALDLLNAAKAIDSGLDLVTRNIDDYDDIPGLTLYKW
jgi:predicted nucleic acid-binding protein